MRLRIVFVSLSLFAMVACTLPNSSIPQPPTLAEAVNSGEAAKSVNEFTTDLYSQLRTETGNLIVSPYSISAALAMTASGAEGSTRAEMQRVLHLPEPDKLGLAFRAMGNGVNASPRGVKHKPELSIANSLWIQKGHPWKKDYLARTRDDFRAGLFDVDFQGNADTARGRINRWVEKETHDRIKDVLPREAITGDTQMILVNAVYFKAKWMHEFKKSNTQPEDFTLANGQKIKVPLLHQRNAFWLLESEKHQVLKLPYEGETTSMYIILPRAHDGLPALEQKLTSEDLAKWTSEQGGAGEVKVWLPKFKFTMPTELTGTLQKIGLREAFDPNRANFRGMTDHPQGVCINRVIHKAFVELDEVGTEAAAASAVTMGLATAAPGMQPPPVPVFRADHPFLFVIKHEITGAVLFIGRVEDPTR